MPFNDIYVTDSYYDAVEYCYARGYFNGTSNTTFEPDTSMTRAMFVTVLYRMAGTPHVSGSNSFTDLTQDWYRDAVLWAGAEGIAKGYGVDVVARLFDRKGIRNYMIEIGGEVVTRGHNPNGETWRIGVTKPTDDSLNVDSELQTVLTISDKAMATSGNYRNFYYQGGRKYAHTIDPRTGYPVQHNILSATVLADRCAVADAYATSFMVLGLDGARSVLSRHPELQAYLIYTDEHDSLCVWDNLQ